MTRAGPLGLEELGLRVSRPAEGTQYSQWNRFGQNTHFNKLRTSKAKNKNFFLLDVECSSIVGSFMASGQGVVEHY